MQKSLPLLSIGTCAGLAVCSGILCHHHTPNTPTIPNTVQTITAHTPIIAYSYGHLPLSFERNQGQVDKQVAFLSHGPGYNLFLTDNQIVLSLRQPKKQPLAAGKPGTSSERLAPRRIARIQPQKPKETTSVLRLKLLGTNAHPQINGMEQQPGVVNYFIGNDPTKWRTDVPTYGRVEYKQVYPGIDMVYYGNQKQLEYDWVVAPGSDVHQIQLGIKGAEKATLTDNGDLQLHTAGGDVVQHAPIAYQEIDGGRKLVSSRLMLASTAGTRAQQISFEVGIYDHTLPLVIDPVLVYSTYLGGGTGDGDNGSGIAVSSVGNAYVTGSTTSMDFPTEVPFQSTLSTSYGNVFVSVLNASGTALIYSTYLGGSGGDKAYGIAIDSSGAAYITGETNSTDFPLKNPYQATKPANGHENAFVTKINPTGSALVYSTYLGGSGGFDTGDDGFGIAIDASGNAYITGVTASTNFPTKNPYQSTNHAPYGDYTAFVTALNASGTGLIYSTYLGGSGDHDDNASAIAVDSSGNAYITGWTTSTDFPTKNAFQPSSGYNSGYNAFVTKINATGSALVYSTYLGGTLAPSEARAVAVDSSGNAYVTGTTSCSDFPTHNPYQATNGSGAFLTKFNSAGSALVYSTYLGGNSYSTPSSIAVDSQGNAYVAGSYSNENVFDFPLVNPIESVPVGFDGGPIGFVTKFNSLGSALLFSTYLGGSANDYVNAIAVDTYGNAYVTGQVHSLDFPVQNPLQGTSHGTTADSNVFIARIGNYNWQTVDLTVGSDNKSRLLWVNTNFTVGLWTVNNSGQSSSLTNIGPFTGYTVQATAAGGDGMTRVLWHKNDGTASLWLLNTNNAFVNGFNFGPYSNQFGLLAWTAVDVAVGSDNKTRLLWTKSDGTVGVWTVDNNGVSSNLNNIGPYAGWTASRIATGKDGLTRLLWTKNDGTVGVWLLNADNTYRAGFNFGPYTGWRGIDIAVGSDNKTRLLWSKSDSTAGVWTVDNNGVASNLTNYGPYTGWTVTKIAAGGDGLSRLLWFKGDGTQGLWLLNANNTFNNGANFGPY